MLRVGLTGGIGAGKSSVAAVLSERGAVVADADRIAREVVEPGTDGLAAVVEEFGEDVLDDSGALDRPALGRVVFGDDDRRQRLNAILHPRIGARTAELVADAPDDVVVVHDVPLLVENGMGAAFPLVVVVDAPPELRLERLRTSRGMSAPDARARMDAQADEAARREAADVWIDNDGTPEDVRAVVDRLWDDRIVPFEANLRAGRAAPAPTVEVDPDPQWPRQARRLAARLQAAGSSWIGEVEHVGPTAAGERTPDVLELVVRTTGRARPRDLADAGFPPVGRHEHGGADPARPVRVELRRAGRFGRP